MKKLLLSLVAIVFTTSLFAKEGHPSRKFGTGNLETIGDITREELIQFYKTHYIKEYLKPSNEEIREYIIHNDSTHSIFLIFSPKI